MIDSAVIAQGMTALAECDPDVADGWALVGDPEPRIRPHGFETLLRIIVSQQLSTQVAGAIMGRLEGHLPKISAEAFLSLDDECLRACGLSGRKIEYGRGIAEKIAARELNLTSLTKETDEDVIGQLVALRGIGVWSAEIYAMFSLGRRDIFPSDDLALQEALKRLKKLEKRPSGREARALVEHWSPWRSVGALFLWRFYRGAPQ